MTGNAVSTTAREQSLGNRNASDDQDQLDTDRWAQTPSTWRREPSIEFRVRSEGQPTRRLRLAGARYTLGNGVGCSIRLEDTSLRSLHAVLIRDHERILVRAYSVPIQINDVRVTEGMINVGDRLRLGSYEFELLENTPRPADAVSQAVAHGLVGFDGHTDSRGDDSSQDWSRSFHEEAKQWRALKQDVQRRDAWCKTRERELIEQQTTLEKQLQALQQREDELQTQESAALEVHEEFQRRYQDLLKHRDELQLQQDELATGREHLRLQQERLDGRDRLHRQQIERLLEEQDRFKRQETVNAQKIAESEERVRASRMQAEAATSAVEQMREKFASLNEQLVQLSQQQETLQQLEADRNREHQQRIEDLEFDRDEAFAQRDEIAEERDASREAQSKIESERKKLAVRCVELESIEEQLRSEIEEMQSEIARTRRDAESLDKDCELARRTISNLEDTIRENRERHEADRESWTAEVETLRTSLEELSLDLAGAQAQLSKLRDENDRLVDQLTGAHAERDEARAERETAMRECDIARGECDAAKIDCEAARRDLEAARTDVLRARQERDDAAAERNAVIAERDELLAFKERAGQDQKSAELSREQWARQEEQAERRYQEAQSHLADARQKCERAVRVRDEAETARLAAEAKLDAAMQDLQAMQAERDLAISEQEELRRQRDTALQDAKDTRELFDRSNRDHDDTLDRIEHLEQKTRDVIGGSGKSEVPSVAPKFGLVGSDIGSIANVDNDSAEAVELDLELEHDDAATVAEPSATASQSPSEAPQWQVEEPAEAALDSLAEVENAGAENVEADSIEPASLSLTADIPAEPETPTELENSVADFETQPETFEPSALSEPAATVTDETAENIADDPADNTPEDSVSASPAALWATETSESIDDQDVWPTYSSVEPEPSQSIVDETSAPMSLLTSSNDVAPEELPPTMPAIPTEEALTDDAPSAWQSTESSMITDETEPAYSEDVSGEAPEEESAWQTTNEPIADSEADEIAAQTVAEALPQWPDESQTYLLPQERSETAEQFDDSAVDAMESADAFDNSYDNEPPYTTSVDDHSAEASFASETVSEPAREWPTHDESSDSASEIPEGSLADQLMRDLGIEKKPSLAIDDESREPSIEDTSATAMWNGRNDWQKDECEEDAPANEIEQSFDQDAAAEANLSDLVHQTVVEKEAEAFMQDDEDGHESDEVASSYSESIEQYRDEREDVAELSTESNEPAAETVVASTSDESELEDDSIEAYMNRLLQRVQGEPAAPAASASKPAAKPVEKPAAPVSKADTHIGAEMDQSESFDKEQADAPETDPNAPLVPRSQAPERNSDLSAMRELANASARSAITRSNKTQSHTTRMQAMVKFGQAGIAMLCGLAAVVLVNLPMLKIIAAVAALIIAGICVKEGFSLLTDLNYRSQSGATPKATEEAAEAEELV